MRSDDALGDRQCEVVCGSVMVRGNNTKSEWWKDEVKAALER